MIIIIIIIYPYRPLFGPTKCRNLGGVNSTIQDGLIHDISIVVHLSLIFVGAGFCVRRDLIGLINARLSSIKGKLVVSAFSGSLLLLPFQQLLNTVYHILSLQAIKPQIAVIFGRVLPNPDFRESRKEEIILRSQTFELQK